MAQRQRLAAAGDAVDQVLPQRLGAPHRRAVHAIERRRLPGPRRVRANAGEPDQPHPETALSQRAAPRRRHHRRPECASSLRLDRPGRYQLDRDFEGRGSGRRRADRARRRARHHARPARTRTHARLAQRPIAPSIRSDRSPAGRGIRSRARRASPSSPARSTNTPSRSWPLPINSSKVIASASRSPASMSRPAWEAPPTSSTSRITSAAARPCCTGSITTPGIHRISCCRSFRTSEVQAATLGGATMPEITIHNPDALGKPLGQYSQITRVKASEFLFIAGQVATDRSGKTVGADDFDAQCRQVFANIEAALKSQGASFANVVEFTTYLVHSQDIAKFMAYRLREFPRLFANGVYPPNTLLIVDRLVQEPFLIEVHTVAAL